MVTTLRVGGATISFNDAKKFTETYLSNTTRTWAYPAYDGYPGHAGFEVGRADLLAVALLNAGQKPVETYYGLESLLGSINTRLADPRLRGTLAEATDETIEAIANLYGILDATKPPQVGLTKLSKVLHRKRPELLPLYDRNIRRCYVHIGDAPVPDARDRTWTELVRIWATAVRHDLVTQYELWTELANLAPGPKITPLRALDIVGWHLGGQVPPSADSLDS